MIQQTVSPVDGRVLVERELAEGAAVERALERARHAARTWRQVPLEQRIAALEAGIDAFVARKAELAEELSWQMGRPISQAPGEIAGFEDRARTMLRLAPEALADHEPTPRDGFTRFVAREPHGVLLLLSPWNYPYLTAVNALVPALAAGNAVLLKHSDQTPLCAERLAEAFSDLPDGVFQVLHMSHDTVAEVVADPRIDAVSFTGSTAGGAAVERAAAGRFLPVGLELGGKDAAYVRGDADPVAAAEALVDGALFNSGQSCCGIERVYVQRELFEPFVARFAEVVRGYRLGNPLDPETNLGPMARVRGADAVRAQVAAAVAAGATSLVDAAGFPAAGEGAYLAPDVLVDVDHRMALMREETFGPVAGLMPVDDDDHAVRLINDSPYGLTAAVYTRDLAAARALGPRLHVGTVFANRCDYLDPELAWVGVKASGRGCTLSAFGYAALTRPKSYHLRHP